MRAGRLLSVKCFSVLTKEHHGQALTLVALPQGEEALEEYQAVCEAVMGEPGV